MKTTVKFKKIKATYLSLPIILLTGCAVPGGHISHRAIDNGTFSSDEQQDLSQKVNVYAINHIPFDAKKTESRVKTNQILQKQIAAYEYYVGAGDVLSITVWDHPELTIPAGSQRSSVEAGNLVHRDGTLFYPYVGNIQVAGLTVRQIREQITKKLSQYIEAPQVDVRVAAFRSQQVYITGEVNRPGNIPITDIPLTIVDALNAVGGISQLAEWENVVLTRNGQEETLSLKAIYQDGDISNNRLLMPNDIVHVNRNDINKVFIMGEINKAQTLKMERNGMSLAEALASSGGFRELTADASGIFVLRQSQDPDKVADVFQLDATDATALILAERFDLQARDVIYVTAAPIARWNRVLSQIMPTVQGLYYIGLAKERLVDNQ